MSDLKPCPFCGTDVETTSDGTQIIVFCDCFDVPYEDAGYDVDKWNTRPLEDALQRKLDEAIGTLKEIAKDEKVIFNYDVYGHLGLVEYTLKQLETK